MLLSTQGKVINRVLLERMKDTSCADQIASLRIIVDQ